jgi:ribosome maturation factor RimP
MGFGPFFIWPRANKISVSLHVHIEGAIERIVNQLGYECVDIVVSGKRRHICVYLDRAGGVSIDDCVHVSNQLTRALDVEGIDYDRLEVSSPGLDRPLKKPEDFERFAGEKATITMRVPVGGRKKFVGLLIGHEAGVVSIALDGVPVSLKFAEIDKARLVPQFR